MVRPVCLIPYYTEDVDKACTSFKIIKYGEEGYESYDHRFKIPTILEPQRQPCLLSICDRDIREKVSHVQLVRVAKSDQLDGIRKRCGAAGTTRDILYSAHSDYLYLMWK